MIKVFFTEKVIPSILTIIIKFVFYSSRWKFLGESNVENHIKLGKPLIVCIWHNRLMMAPCLWKWGKHNPLHVLASAHKDGKLIANIVKKFNMPAIFGSTGKGIGAMRDLIKLSKSGEYIAITPDGPRGPKYKVAPGIVAIAKIAKVDIIPLSFNVKRYKKINSWDNFKIIFPFNKAVGIWGEPIKHETLQDLNQKESEKIIEDSLAKISQISKNVLLEK